MDHVCSISDLAILDKPVTLITPLKNEQVVEDNSVSFTCQLSKPDQPVQWLKNGSPIKQSTKYKISSDGSKYTLTLQKATIPDAGEYKIKLGNLESSAKLTVSGEDKNVAKFHIFIIKHCIQEHSTF